MTYDKVQNVLKVTILDKIDNESDLNRFHDNLLVYLDRQHIASARSSTKKKAFLQNLNDTLGKIEKPIKINPTEYKTLKKEHEALISESIEYENEITALKAQIKKLEKCKDASQVSQIKSESLSDNDKFIALKDNCETSLEKLSSFTIYILYLYFNRKNINLKEEYCYQEMKQAEQDSYIKIDEDNGEITPNLNDKSIKEALNSINNLKDFLENNISPELYEKLTNDYAFDLSLSNIRFWEQFSSIRSYM